MFELTIKGDIASAHFIPGYKGNCGSLHGHTWKIELTVCGEQLDSLGMLVDFKVIKKQFKDFLDGLDHACLNELPYFVSVPPSTENIARHIYREFGKICRPLKVKRVRVWESDTSDITYYE